MDEAIAAALSAARTLVVPSRQRAAALALAWARLRIAAGDAVWPTPEILSFEAWLAREWQRARVGGKLARPLQLLNTAQERRLWTQVLAELEAGGSPWEGLTLHAPALMRSAARARRSLLDLGLAATAEQRLLAQALRAVDRHCAANGWLVPGLARPADLEGLQAQPPVFAGFPQPPALSAVIGGADAAALPLPAPRAEPLLHAAADARCEVEAAAAWCRQMLQQDPRRRLLVIHRGGDLSLEQVGGVLWDGLAAATRAEAGEPPDPGLLAIEGGRPLLEQALFADALSALSLLGEPLDLDRLSALLLSPHFSVLPPREALQLELALRRVPRQPLSFAGLRAMLGRLAARNPGAAPLAQALEDVGTRTQCHLAAGAATWASRFDTALQLLGFPGTQAMDSREAQRLSRWRELLDEFATLEGFAPAMDAAEALAQLQQLARHGRHEAAGLDAAVTLTADGGDPLASYDGIWVMGLTQSRWPEPPRPDAFVSLAEQQRAAWPEASVALRARQARFELGAWRARTPRLVLSYGKFSGDVRQLPSALAVGFAAFEPAASLPPPLPAVLVAQADEALPALAAPGVPVPLPRGVRGIELQHDCPFRAQAELRLGAAPREFPPEGIDARLRGDLLHAALQQLWARLSDSTSLQGLDIAARARLCAAAWDRAQAPVIGRLALPPPPRALARERRRGLRLLEALLEIEAARPPFHVLERETAHAADFGGPSLRLRIDRIDAFGDGSRRVIDYKTGATARVDFDLEPPRPLQLAVYAAALAQTGPPPEALALLSISSRQLRMVGGGREHSEAAEGLDAVPDWDARLARWTRLVAALAAAQVAGVARVAPLPGACSRCHLPGFCRIGIAALVEEEPPGDTESADE